MKKVLLIFCLAFAANNSNADGVTDFIIHPTLGYTISVAGHYRLSADAYMTADVAGITVFPNDVTIDLNNHSIVADASSTQDGIAADTNGITVRNGAIRGFGAHALSLGSNAHVTDCVIEGNNRAGNAGGISVGFNSRVEACNIRRNSPVGAGSTFGIFADIGCHIKGNTVDDNNSPSGDCDGIAASTACVVEGNIVQDNDGFSAAAVQGISVSAGSIVRNNVVRNNDNLGSGPAVGIEITGNGIIEGNHCDNHTGGTTPAGSSTGIRGTACVIKNNQCSSNNGRASSGAPGRGIEVNSQSRVIGNHCRGNTGEGVGIGIGILVTGTSNEIRENSCVSNSAGGVVSGWGIRVEGDSNVVSGNTTITNKRGGMIFTSANNNRADSNRMREQLGIDTNPPGVNPQSLGAGDLANVTF